MDLLDSLRSHKMFFRNGGIWLMSPDPDPDCVEAADEIDRLRAENEHLKAEIELLHVELWANNAAASRAQETLAQENERLQKLVNLLEAEIDRLR